MLVSGRPRSTRSCVLPSCAGLWSDVSGTQSGPVAAILCRGGNASSNEASLGRPTATSSPVDIREDVDRLVGRVKLLRYVSKAGLADAAIEPGVVRVRGGRLDLVDHDVFDAELGGEGEADDEVDGVVGPRRLLKRERRLPFSQSATSRGAPRSKCLSQEARSHRGRRRHAHEPPLLGMLSRLDS